MTTLVQRRGFAVATALFALAVVGALAIGTLFAATHELRAGSQANVIVRRYSPVGRFAKRGTTLTP